MTLVDSSVWIDYFRGTTTPQTDLLDAMLGTETLATGDIILTEVLQGFARQDEFDLALNLMNRFEIIDIGGADIAVLAAQNFRALRGFGITVRKTIDTLIATRCIENGYALLYSDRDFDPFVQHLGLLSPNQVET